MTEDPLFDPWGSAPEPPEDVGLCDLPTFPTTFLGQLASPLRWRKIKTESAAVIGRTTTARRSSTAAMQEL